MAVVMEIMMISIPTCWTMNCNFIALERLVKALYAPEAAAKRAQALFFHNYL